MSTIRALLHRGKNPTFDNFGLSGIGETTTFWAKTRPKPLRFPDAVSHMRHSIGGKSHFGQNSTPVSPILYNPWAFSSTRKGGSALGFWDFSPPYPRGFENNKITIFKYTIGSYRFLAPQPPKTPLFPPMQETTFPLSSTRKGSSAFRISPKGPRHRREFEKNKFPFFKNPGVSRWFFGKTKP